MKALMLSGITGTGKSTLFGHLVQKVGDLSFSSKLLFSSYHCQNFFKETNLEIKNIYAFYKQIFDFEIIESLKTIGALFENSFFNVCLEYQLNEIDISSIESFLAKKQCKQVILTLPEDEIYKRSILTTRIYRKPSWSKYLASFNMSDEQLTSMYIEKQNRLLDLAKHSSCPTIIINTAEMEWDTYVEVISDFWLE